MCTLFSEKINDLRVQASLDRHIGHSRKIAELFYELNCKLVDAVVTFRAVDAVLSSTTELNQESKKILDETKFKDAVFQFKGKTFETELIPCTEEIELAIQQVEPINEDEEDSMQTASQGATSSAVMNNLQFPIAELENDLEHDIPSETDVVQFLVNKARKRSLSIDQYRVVADFFLRGLRGQDRGTLKELHSDIQAVRENAHANYNHVCFLVKKLNSWKENSFAN